MLRDISSLFTEWAIASYPEFTSNFYTNFTWGLLHEGAARQRKCMGECAEPS